MHNRFIAVWILLIGLLTSLDSFGQQYDVSVTSIEVWVKVVQDGKTITGLSEDAFEVYEDDKPVPVTCFEETFGRIPSGSSETQTQTQSLIPAQEETPAPRQKLIVFLDLYNMTSAEYSFLKPKLTQSLNQLEGKNWDIMIAVLTTGGRLGIVQQFTHDLKRVTKVLDQASRQTNQNRDQQMNIKRKTITGLLQGIKEGTIPADDGLRDCYRISAGYAREEKNVTMFSLHALESFSTEISARIGQEHAALLYISGGFNVDPGRLYYELINRFVDKSTGSEDTTDFALRFPESTREPNFDVRGEITKSVGKLNRNNITAYTISSRGLVNPGEDFTSFQNDNIYDLRHDFQESLSQIAKETGGLSFENTNNFSVGFGHVMTDLDQQYTICYRPPVHAHAGGYHRIKIVCKRAGVSVRYRQGYID